MHEQLELTREALRRAELPLETPSAAEARTTRTALLRQLTDYLIPRYQQWNAPLLAVVGGSTGAGKSTLVNSLVGETVSAASAIRPTTHVPVLVHHPADAGWFAAGHLLPRWARLEEPSGSGSGTGRGPTNEAVLAPHPTPRVPAGMAIIDAPDIDSVAAANRERSRDLLGAADLWIFVTTGMRYADAVPWELLRHAAERDVVLAVVLNRVPTEHATDIAADLRELLESHGLGGTTLFTIGEQPLDGGLLPAGQVAPLRDWLELLHADEARAAVIRQTLHGATRHALGELDVIIASLRDHHEAAAELDRVVSESYCLVPVQQALADGALLRNEVLAQWQDFLGTGEFFRALEAGVGKARDRVAGWFRKPQAGQRAARVNVELAEGFARLLTDTATAGALAAHRGWSALSAGRGLLTPELATVSPGLAPAVARELSLWQHAVLDLVRTHGHSKRTNARLAAAGINVVATALIIVSFASTGGLLGAEVAIAGGTAVVSQRVLEAIFGENGVRTLAAQAQADLLARAETVLGSEAARFRARIPELADPGDLRAVRDAVATALAESAR